MNTSARTAAQILRLRARATRAKARALRPKNPAKLAKSCQYGARSIATHALPAGVAPETAKGIASALGSVAKRTKTKATRTNRSRRTLAGWGRTVRTTRRYSRAKIVQLLEAYKPRKAEFREARDLMLAA